MFTLATCGRFAFVKNTLGSTRDFVNIIPKYFRESFPEVSKGRNERDTTSENQRAGDGFGDIAPIMMPVIPFHGLLSCSYTEKCKTSKRQM